MVNLKYGNPPPLYRDRHVEESCQAAYVEAAAPPPTPTLTSLLCFRSCPPAQQLSFLHRGLLSNLYLHTPDCPVPLLQWLFQVRSADLPLDGGSALAQHPGQHCCGEDGHVPPLAFGCCWVCPTRGKRREAAYGDSHPEVQGLACGRAPLPDQSVCLIGCRLCHQKPSL